MHDRRDFQLFRSITRKLYEAGSNIPKNCVTAITISHLFRSEVYTSDPTVRILLPRFNRINIDVIYIFLKLEKDTFHLFQFFINRNSSSLFPISIAFYITSPYISKYIYDKSVKFILINLKMKYLKKKKFLWNVDSLYAQIYIYISILSVTVSTIVTEYPGWMICYPRIKCSTTGFQLHWKRPRRVKG